MLALKNKTSTAIVSLCIGMVLFLILKTFFLDEFVPRKMSFFILNSTSSDIFLIKIKSGGGGLIGIDMIPKDGYVEKSSWMNPGECWSLECTSNGFGIRKNQLQIYGFNPKDNEIIVFDDMILSNGISMPYTDIDCYN